MKTELSRFRVKPGKSEKVDEWMAFLSEHMADVLLTLDQENMYVESIFRDHRDGYEYLYWFSIQGDHGAEVEDSDHWIDKQHLAYWEECVDKSYPPADLTTEVVMIPSAIRAQMKD
ncbi:DUF6176 family protein [Bacillus daqingensis]|uniref:DUF6176 family protein n=1 Tax=Bacillus daqingensis TaxID=872396 RepID=A0ABV9NUV4_9BACI